jgi:hypothetical protein
VVVVAEVKRSRRKPLPPHWYLRYIRECPVCGRSREERIRQFTPRPENPADRVDYNGMAYDYCDV